MKDSFVLWFLYQTILGRVLLKLLIQPGVSKAAGYFLSSKISGRLVPYYIRRHNIDMRGIVVPPEGFSSFNAFFTGKRLPEHLDLSHGNLISPCDGLLTLSKIQSNTVFDIKQTHYSLEDLLKDPTLAMKFKEGTALIFRLTPAHYHRYCYAVDGFVCRSRKIRGKLHCVRPIALHTVPVYTQNSREYQIIRTQNFGTVIQMEVGALLVGKIKNHHLPSAEHGVHAGEEKGYFEFGGSTIILLLQKDAVRIHEHLYERQNRNGEISVHMGEPVAQANKSTFPQE